MAENIDQDMQKLYTELGDLRADISEINETLTRIVRRRTTEIFDASHASVDKIANGARNAAVSAINQAVSEIEERPFLALVSVLAVGMTVGFLINRRS